MNKESGVDPTLPHQMTYKICLSFHWITSWSQQFREISWKSDAVNLEQLANCWFTAFKCDPAESLSTISGKIMPDLSSCVLNTGLPWSIMSMPNADQCRSKSWHWSEMPLNGDWSALIRIDRHWDQCQNFDLHWLALIGIGHWSGESCKQHTANWTFFLAWNLLLKRLHQQESGQIDLFWVLFQYDVFSQSAPIIVDYQVQI